MAIPASGGVETGQLSGMPPEQSMMGWGMPLAHSATSPASYGKAFWTISPVSGMKAAAAMERACTSSPMPVRQSMAGTSCEMWQAGRKAEA